MLGHLFALGSGLVAVAGKATSEASEIGGGPAWLSGSLAAIGELGERATGALLDFDKNWMGGFAHGVADVSDSVFGSIGGAISSLRNAGEGQAIAQEISPGITEPQIATDPLSTAVAQNHEHDVDMCDLGCLSPSSVGTGMSNNAGISV